MKRTTSRSASASFDASLRERKSKRSVVSFMMPANSRFISAMDGSDRGPWKSRTIVIPSRKRSRKQGANADQAHTGTAPYEYTARCRPPFWGGASFEPAAGFSPTPLSG